RVSLQDNGRAHPHPCGSSIVSGKPGDRIPHRRWGKKRSPPREVVRSGTVDRGERLSLQYTTALLLLSISYKGREEAPVLSLDEFGEVSARPSRAGVVCRSRNQGLRCA